MLDADICIYLTQRHLPQVAARYCELRHVEVVMSAITHVELRYGVERPLIPKECRVLFQTLPSLNGI